MNSSSSSDILAVFQKEATCELRSKSAIYTALLLTGVTVFTLAFAYFGRVPEPESAAGMLWAALLFSGAGTLIRAYVNEEEQGTGDLLRLWARPVAVFWGKTLFAFVQMTVTASLAAIVFIGLTSVDVARWSLLGIAIIGGAAALAGVITLVSALICRGRNRGALGAAIAIPLLLPVLAMGINAFRGAFDPLITSAWSGCAGVWLYTVLVFAAAPYQFALVWGEP